MRRFKENKGLFMLIPALLIILAAMLMPGVSSAVSPDTWTYTSNSYYIWDTAYGEGTYVGVGYYGTIITSTDNGATWTQRTSGTTAFLYSVIYNPNDPYGGKFVAVGDGGTILSSPDGITWTNNSISGSTENFYSIAYGNYYYVAVSYSGRVYTAYYNNLSSWTDRGDMTAYTFYDIAYNSTNNLFVAVGSSGLIMTSADNGITWTARTSGTTNTLKSIVYANGTFVVAGYNGTILTSTDGITWTLRTSSASLYLRSVAYGDGSFVVSGDSGTIWASTDNGVTWWAKTSNSTTYIFSIAYGDGYFVAPGYYSHVVSNVTTSSPTAADNTSLTFTAGGDAKWFGENMTKYYGGSALQSGDIDNGVSPTYVSSSWIQTTVTGPLYLSYYGKVSSETNYDYLRFYVDGVEQGSISGSVDWTQLGYTIASGSHTLKWAYTKDGSVSANSDAAWIDKVCTYYVYPGDYNLNTAGSHLFTSSSSSNSYVTVSAQSGCSWTAVSNTDWITANTGGTGNGSFYYTVGANATGAARTGTMTVAGQTFTITQGSSVSMGTALGNTSLPNNTAPFSSYTNAGSASWTGQNASPFDTQNAAQSGDISFNQTSYFSTTVTGPMTLSYYWKVSSQPSADYLKFYDGATTVYSTSGEVDWAQKTYSVPTGSHTLKWEYSKDVAWSKASDAGWVNRVCTYQLASNSSNIASPGGSSSVNLTVSGDSCSWTATSNQAWLTITAGNSGTGSGTISFSVSATTDTVNNRSGIITIYPAGQVTNGQTFTVSQTKVIGLDTSLNFGTGSSWTTGGNANWFGQNTGATVANSTAPINTHDGTSAQSGKISDSGITWMQTTITNARPYTLSFWWLASSDGPPTYPSVYDRLNFYIDGVQQDYTGGTNINWAQKVFNLASGTHTLKWSYTKDSVVSLGDDAAWVDQICTYDISADSASYKSSATCTGGSCGSFNITTQAGCGWTATVTNSAPTVSSITASANYTGSGASASGSGTQTLNYSVEAHNNGWTRSATITIYAAGTAVNGQVFTINQGANIPTLSLTPLSPVNLGTVQTNNSATKTQEFTLVNTGSGALTVASIATCVGSIQTTDVCTADVNKFVISTTGTSPYCTTLTNLSMPDSGAGSSCKVTVTFKTDTSNLNVGTLRVVSNHLNVANTKSQIALSGYGDGTAPTTTASVPAGLYNTDQTVTLMCADNADGSGCAYLAYTTNGVDPPTYLANSDAYSAYSTPVTLATITANTTVKFRSIDSVSNQEIVKSVTYNIDKTAPAAGNVQTFVSIPKTGQTTCYDNTPASYDCAGATNAGQDGKFASQDQNGKAWPATRFVITYRNSTGPCTDQTADCDADTSNDVITDKLTGLMWPRRADTPTVSGNETCTGGIMSWTNAISTYVDCLNSEHYLGYTDWRMPNRNEMASLINIEASNPTTWLNTQGFVSFASGSYLTSTSDLVTPGNAWIATLSTGKVVSDGKGVAYYVHPVRDSNTESTLLLPKTGQTASSTTNDDGDLELGEKWPSPRFKDNGDGTVLDNLTGLVWLEDGSTPTAGACTGGTMNWQNALAYVTCLNTNIYKGVNDWRLPNRNELSSLFNASQSSNATWLNNNEFKNFPLDSSYWTSSTSATTTTKAWFVKIDSGLIDYNTKTTQLYYVLPVRSGKLASPLSGAGIYAGFGESQTKSSSVVLTLYATDANTVTEMKLSNNNIDWSDETPYTTNKTWTLSSGDGDKTVYVQFKDNAGNWSSATISDSITVDSAAPTTTASPAGGIVGAGQQVILTASEAGSTIYYTINGDVPTTSLTGYASPKTVTISANTTLKFLSVDSLGNAESYKTETYTIDSGAPLTNASPAGGSYKTTQSVALTCNDASTGNSGCVVTYYTTNGNDPTASSDPYSGPISISASSTLKFRSKDNAGNFEDVRTQAYVIDSGIPTVAVTSPADGSLQKSLSLITGSVTETGGSGLASVEVQITDGTLYVNSSKMFDVITPDNAWIAASTSGSTWSFAISNGIWSSNTTYTINVRATDVAGNVSPITTITFTKAPDINLGSTLSLDLSSQTILKDATIDVSGKITSMPDVSGLKNLTVVLTITAPDKTTTAYNLTTSDSAGHFQKIGLGGFTQKGTYTITALFNGDSNNIISGSSNEKTVLVGASAGYAILVQGKISNGEGLASHNKTANRIYSKMVTDRGFRAEDVYYFNYTAQTGVDAAPDKTAIQNAVTSWAKDKLNAFAAPLYIILVNHGDKDVFHINYENITPDDLNSWLGTLEGGLNTAALAEKRIVIIGACYSGSFIPKVAKSGRIIITSAAADEESYKGPKEDDDIRSGEFFLEEFFKQLANGYSFRKSFELATDKTEKFTGKGGNSANSSNKYFDSAMQHPLLDDSGSGSGSNSLAEGSTDGSVANDMFFGTGTNNLTNSSGSGITGVTETKYLTDSESAALLWLTVTNNSEIGSAWTEIRVPSKVLAASSSSEQLSIDLPKVTMSSLNNRWETTDAAFNSAGISFSEAGKYEIYYYTKDNTAKAEISPMKRSVVYKNKIGNHAPSSFSLVSDSDSPADGETKKTVLVFKWNATSDPDGDDLTYNLVIATESGFNNVVYKKEEITDPMAFVDMTAGLKDLTTYYWKIEAVDIYGSVTTSTQKWSFTTNNTNGYPGVVTGIVYSDTESSKISAANTKIDIGGVTVDVKNGTFMVAMNSGTVTLTGSATGYNASSVSGVSVKAGETTVVNIRMAKADATAPTTTAVPAGGTYSSAQSVTLTANEASTIYYTADGSTPTAGSTVYSTAITISANTTLKYFAVDSKGNAESEKTQTYVITTVGSGTGGQADTTAPTTTPAPAGGTYDSAQSVTLTASETSTIYYTVDGSAPTTASTQYSGAISVSTTTTLMFFAVDTAGNPESVKTETYTIVIAEPDTTVPDTTAPVTMVSLGGGSYPSTMIITVELTCEDETDGSGCSAIYYSVDGSSPSTVYSGPITISATTTLKFYSVDAAGNAETPVNEETYTIVTVAATQASLSVSKLGTGKGTITSLTSKVADGKIDCDADCDVTGYVYDKKTKVTLKAEADDDSTFTGWSGGCKGKGTCLVTITKDVTVIATFVAKPVLTVIKDGSGSGTIKGGPSATCETETGCSVNYNQKVGLTAKADKGSVFLGWSGGACKGKAKCALTMSADKSVTATFGKPEISVSTENVTFDSLSIKSKVPSRSSFMITNNGDADLKVTKMAITSTVKGDAALFKVTGKTGVIKAGASATVSMTFKPKTAGEKSATLKITSTDPDAPVMSITLSGTGTAAADSSKGLSPFNDESDKTGAGPDKLNFNPEGLVSREEAAAFIIAALEGLNEKTEEPQSILRSCDDGSSFADLEAARWSCGYIKTLHDIAGETVECETMKFCPDDLMTKVQLDEIMRAITGQTEDSPVQDLSSILPITREQMAVAIIKAFEGEPEEDYCGTESIFEDIASESWSCRYIKRLYELIGN